MVSRRAGTAKGECGDLHLFILNHIESAMPFSKRTRPGKRIGWRDSGKGSIRTIVQTPSRSLVLVNQSRRGLVLFL